MKILINERLSEHRCKTPEGYLICTDAILARTGKQTYRKNEIFKDSDDDTEIEVDRTEDEVFSPQTLASFENKPVTVEHPDEDVNVHNYKEYAVGFVRDVHRGEVDGQPVILGNLVITDEQTIQEIENGEHTDLSCGYDCDIADEANPCQRNIRGNHVALCECGRAGIARIVDSKCKDANHLPAKVKHDLQKFLNHKSTFIRNKDYDISEFVNEFERVSRLWAEFPLKIVRESIKGWFKTGDGMMRKDYTFSIEGYDDRFMVSIYAKPDTYETTELNAYFTDSVKDARMKVANLMHGYAIVPASKWRKFGLNSEVERFTTNLDEARYIRSSLERNDGISFVIVDVTQRRTTDSVKDRKYKSENSEMKNYVKDGEIDRLVEKYTNDLETTITSMGRKVMVELSERDEYNTALIKALKKAGFEQLSSFRFVKDSIKDREERLFTVKYEQGDTTYIHKVRASSIEDAISKVKDDDDINKLQQLIAETLSARADAWRNDKQKEIRQAKENIASAIGAEQNTRRDIKEFHTLPEYVRRIAEKEARSELKQYDYLLNIQNKIYEKYSSLMREAESLAKTIEAKYNVKLNLELNRSGGEREAIRILKTMRK